MESVEPIIPVNDYQDFEDKISNLPDEMISHILSLMPTKFAVRTSILSTRWQYLWTSITNLDFDFDFYHDKTNNNLRLASFIGFVDRVLRLCKSSQIQLFRLNFASLTKIAPLVENWIAEAIRLNPNQIVVEVFNSGIPLSLFTCKTLTVLKVDSFKTETPSSMDLPNLKVLQMGLIAEDLFQLFIDGCPMLEDVSFFGWIIKEKRYVLNIRAPAMKRLEFRRCLEFRRGSTVHWRSEIVIDAPNLEYLNISSNVKLRVENLQSLVEVILHLNYWRPQDEDEDPNWSSGDCFIELLRRVSGTKSLSLHLDSQYEMDVEVFLHGVKLPTFHYLTSLEMVFTKYSTRKFLPCFLESSPNLEYLSLEIPGRNYLPLDDDSWYKKFIVALQIQFVSNCSLLHLKEIKLKGFDKNEDDLIVVAYLLRNAENLKRLKVFCTRLTLAGEIKYCNEFLTLRKAAVDCKIEFHGHHLQIPCLEAN